MSQASLSSPFLPLPDGMVITSVYEASSDVAVHVTCRLSIARCPLCQQPSERVHGAYVRTVADLPCAGRRVMLLLTVRKFVCGTPTCSCKIFTERLPELVPSYARMTNRLNEALQTLGFATCGQLGERLAPTAETFPERQEQAYRGSILDPYKSYILERWQAGCWKGTQLYEEVRKRGYTGSASFFRRFIAKLRKKHRSAGDSAVLALDPLSATKVTIPDGVDPPPQVRARLSATRASWLCVSQPAKPDERHLQQLALLRQAHPDFEKAYQLSQAFVSMLKERRGGDLDAWLNRAEHSGIVEIQSFAQGLRRDDSAVRAVFSSEWSNGQVESHS